MNVSIFSLFLLIFLFFYSVGFVMSNVLVFAPGAVSHEESSKLPFGTSWQLKAMSHVYY